MPDAIQYLCCQSLGDGLICRCKCGKPIKSYPTIGVEIAGCAGMAARPCLSEKIKNSYTIVPAAIRNRNSILIDTTESEPARRKGEYGGLDLRGIQKVPEKIKTIKQRPGLCDHMVAEVNFYTLAILCEWFALSDRYERTLQLMNNESTETGQRDRDPPHLQPLKLVGCKFRNALVKRQLWDASKKMPHTISMCLETNTCP